MPAVASVGISSSSIGPTRMYTARPSSPSGSDTNKLLPRLQAATDRLLARGPLIARLLGMKDADMQALRAEQMSEPMRERLHTIVAFLELANEVFFDGEEFIRWMQEPRFHPALYPCIARTCSTPEGLRAAQHALFTHRQCALAGALVHDNCSIGDFDDRT